MKVKMLITAIILIVITSCSSQRLLTKNEREIRSNGDILKTTTWVRANNQNQSVTGTGYYFYDIDKYKYYLITNRHIVDGFEYLTFALDKEGGKGDTFTIDSLSQRTILFKSKNVDLAAVEIGNIPYLNLTKFPYFKVFTKHNLPTPKDVSEFDIFFEELICLTYPGITTIPFPFQPYIFHCSFATTYDDAFQNDSTIFSIQSYLNKGSSGSPIISVKKSSNKFLLLGTYYFQFANYEDVDYVSKITHDLHFKPETYKKDSTQKEIKSILNLGIGLVVKSNQILELIENK